MELRRVVITGIGAITPIGNTAPEYWDNLCKGVSGAGKITRFDSTKLKTHIACEIKGYDSEAYFDRKESRKLDLYAQYAIVAADEAIKDSRIDKGNTDFDEVGVVFASGIGGISSLYYDMMDSDWNGEALRLSPFIIPRLLPDLASGHISIKHGFRGANFATVSACASSAHSIIEGYNNIHYGKTEVMIVGGSEAAICPIGIGGFEAMKALSMRNDDPQTASRPFDAERDGFVMGEGAGCFVLEELGHALRRDAKIYGEIVGCGISADAYHMTAPHPEGLGATLSMKRALLDAQLSPNDIDHINTCRRPARSVSHKERIRTTLLQNIHQLRQVDDRTPLRRRRSNRSHLNTAGLQKQYRTSYNKPFQRRPSNRPKPRLHLLAT